MLHVAITDETLGLLAILIGLLAYARLFARPTPLIHPLLLASQAAVSEVRQAGESGAYRNWATGRGNPLPTKPSGSVNVVSNVLDTATQHKVTRFGHPISNDNLKDLSTTLMENILSVAGEGPDSKTIHLIAILPSCMALLLIHLGRSLRGDIRLSTLLSPDSLSAVIVKPKLSSPDHRSAIFCSRNGLEAVLNQLSAIDRSDLPTCIVIVDEASEKGISDEHVQQLSKRARDMGKDADITSEVKGVRVIRFEDMLVERPYGSGDTAPQHRRPLPADVHSTQELPSGYGSPAALVEATNENMTASMAALMSIFPASKRPSSRTFDTVLSQVDMRLAIGLGIALTGLHAGAGLEVVGDDQNLQHACQAVSPTVAFVYKCDIIPLCMKIDFAAARHPLYSFAKRHKLAGIDEGYVERTGLLERLIWQPARRGSGVERLRALVILDDSPTVEETLLILTTLSVPFIRMHTHSRCSGPIFASHALDLQTMPAFADPTWAEQGKMHTGGPASNVEVVLKGPEVERLEKGLDPIGQVYLRHGPTTLRPATTSNLPGEDGYISLGIRAAVQPNGTFVII